jgi:hypothetical protein
LQLPPIRAPTVVTATVAAEFEDQTSRGAESN